MKPVKNKAYSYYQIGDVWRGQRIMGLSPCIQAGHCRTHYLNFEIACGGYERDLDGEFSPKCIFWIVDGGYLSDENGGRRLE